MAWSEIAPGRYERPLSGREQALWYLGASRKHEGVEEWIMLASATLQILQSDSKSLLDIIPALKSAWAALRFEHPNIAAQAPTADKAVYFIPNGQQDIDMWIGSTFHVEHNAEDTHAVANNIKLHECPFIHIIPRSAEILIATQHWRGDGRGVMRILGRYLELLGQELEQHHTLEWGKEVSRLVPSADDIADLLNTLPQSAQSALDYELAGFLKLKHLKGFTLDVSLDGPRKASCHDQLVLSEEATSILVAACKRRNVSLNAVTHAACAVLNRDLAGPGQDIDRQVLPVRRDIRPLLPEPWNGPPSASACIVTSTACEIKLEAPFEEYVKVINDFYKHGYTRENLEIERVLWAKLVELMMTSTSTPPPALDVDFTSFGIADEFIETRLHGGLRLKDMTFRVAGYDPTAGMWTYTLHGRLNLVIGWNDGYRSRASMRSFTEGMVRLISSKFDLPDLLNL